MATVEPVTEQPEPTVVDVGPPTQGDPPSSATGTWSSGLCGCCGDIGSCKYFIITYYLSVLSILSVLTLRV